MENLEEAVQHPNFKDRKKWLVAFGVCEIIIGLIFVLIALSFLFMYLLYKNSNIVLNNPNKEYYGLFYGILAVWVICMGIGSIKARRWARALILVTSWMWLISGIIGIISMMIFMPDILSSMVQSGKISEARAQSLKYAMLVMYTFMLIVVPGVLVLFYGSKNVKATCEFRNPQPGWTDKCPLPVLALCIISLSMAGAVLLRGFYGWYAMFFGYILNGMAGAGVAIVEILLLFYVAWGVYKLNIKAWWCAVLMTIVKTISVFITYLYANIWDLYEKMNLSAKQIDIMKNYSMPPSTMAFLFLFSGVCALGYLLYVRKFFLRNDVVK